MSTSENLQQAGNHIPVIINVDKGRDEQDLGAQLESLSGLKSVGLGRLIVALQEGDLSNQETAEQYDGVEVVTTPEPGEIPAVKEALKGVQSIQGEIGSVAYQFILLSQGAVPKNPQAWWHSLTDSEGDETFVRSSARGFEKNKNAPELSHLTKLRGFVVRLIEKLSKEPTYYGPSQGYAITQEMYDEIMGLPDGPFRAEEDKELTDTVSGLGAKHTALTESASGVSYPVPRHFLPLHQYTGDVIAKTREREESQQE
jgi:hypothetical protein